MSSTFFRSVSVFVERKARFSALSHWFFPFCFRPPQEVILCGGPWRSSIIPYTGVDVNTFLQVFRYCSIFKVLCAVALAADDLIILPQKRFFVKHFFEDFLKFLSNFLISSRLDVRFEVFHSLGRPPDSNVF